MAGQLFLVKCPRFLMAHLEARASTGAPLGSIQETPAPDKPGAAAASSYKLTLPEAGLPEGLPREYEFRFQTTPPASHIFTAPKEGAPEHTGRVVAKGELFSGMTAEYRNILNQRAEAAMKKDRATGMDMRDAADQKAALNHQQIRADEKAAKKRKQEVREAGGRAGITKRQQAGNRQLSTGGKGKMKMLE